MSSLTYRSSRSDQWTSPRPYSDASLRYRAHGPVQPMDYAQPSLLTRALARLTGRRIAY